MKLEKFLLATLAAGMFAACSSDEPINGPGNEAMQGDGYVAITINLPTTPASSRAANDDFNDGDPKEYQVNSGALILFTGANEQSAVFKAAYPLNLPTRIEGVDNDNITTSYLTAVKIDKVEATDNLFGLVMLNYTGVVQTIAADGSLNIYTEATSTDTEPFAGTFAQLLAKTSKRAFYNGAKDDFFMTNAPLSTVAGGTVGTPAIENVTTLVSLNNSLKATEEEAKAAPAGSIFVERAVAKATLSNEATEAVIGADKKKLSIIGNASWLLDNTEPTSYIVRNMGDGSYMGFANGDRGHRFAGTTVMGTTSIQPKVNLFRTYWCVDPHYDVLPEGETLATATSFSDDAFIAAGTASAKSTPLYCHENTFTTAAQDKRHTTRAIIKVAYSIDNNGEGKTFYTVNGVEDELYTSAADAESFSLAFILNNDGIKAAIKEALPEGSSVSLNETNYKDYLTINFARDDNDGYRKVTEIKFKNNAAFETAPVWTAEQEASLIEITNGYYRIEEYENGINYYALRFKHFAGSDFSDPNDLAPWNPALLETANTPTTSEAYPGEDADNKWLGRYGMVRNNWYDVTISGFKHLGKPAPGSLDVSKDKTPDDEKETEQWIAFKVNILSWALRTQKHEF